MKKTLAVITPCYNAEAFIADCIASVQASNTFNAFTIEHVIVDDGSTDASAARIRSLMHPALRFFSRAHNAGAAAARNYAIKQTNADYLYCLDADDVLLQNALSYALAEALRSDSAWVYGDFLRGDASLKYEIGNDYYGWPFQSIEDVLTALFTGTHFFQHNCLFTKKLFDAVGGYDETLRHAQDFDLFTRFLLADTMPAYLPTVFHIHRNHGNNLSVKYHAHPDEHRKDVRAFFATYEHQLDQCLSSENLRRIRHWLNA